MGFWQGGTLIFLVLLLDTREYGGEQVGAERKPPQKCQKVTVEWPNIFNLIELTNTTGYSLRKHLVYISNIKILISNFKYISIVTHYMTN